MQISPQEEDLIIKMILRDARQAILREKPGVDFKNINFQVKLQKIVFIIAEELEIPLTRSWYLYGGYVHNDLVDIEKLIELEDSPQATFDLLGNAVEPSRDQKDIEYAESLLGDKRNIYKNKIRKIATKIFFKKYDEFLLDFYSEMAPEPYKQLYLNNARLNQTFKRFEGLALRAEQPALNAFCPELPEAFSDYYRAFTAVLSKLGVEVAKGELSEFYDLTLRYIELLERYLIKAGFDRKVLSRFKLLADVYKKSLWKTVALSISTKTVKGVRSEEVGKIQRRKLEENLASLPSSLDQLEAALIKEGLLPTRSEMIRFYEKTYGDRKELTEALIGVLRPNA
jgi:hypothetical protein